MTKATAAPLLASTFDADWQPTEAAANEQDLLTIVLAQREQIALYEPVIGAATLVSTAFRMRDEESLITALRLLCTALDTLGEDAATA